MEHVVHDDRPVVDLEDDQEREPLNRRMPEAIHANLVMGSDGAEMFQCGEDRLIEPITQALLLRIIPQ